MNTLKVQNNLPNMFNQLSYTPLVLLIILIKKHIQMHTEEQIEEYMEDSQDTLMTCVFGIRSET